MPWNNQTSKKRCIAFIDRIYIYERNRFVRAHRFSMQSKWPK